MKSILVFSTGMSLLLNYIGSMSMYITLLCIISSVMSSTASPSLYPLNQIKADGKTKDIWYSFCLVFQFQY